MRTVSFCLLLIAVLVAQMLLSVSQAESADEIDKVQQQILQADEQLQALNEEIAQGREQKKQLQAAVKAVGNRVGERQSRLDQLNVQITAFEQKLRSMENLITQEQLDADARRQALANAVRQTQRLGSHAGLKVLLQHDDPALADRLNVYAEHLLRAQRDAITKQSKALEQIETAKAAALKDRNWLNYIQKKARSQYEGFTAEQVDKNQDLLSVEQQLATRIRNVSELKADQARLQKLMEELKAAQNTRSGYFASNKGRYPLPVQGTIEARFGEIKSVGKIRWAGLFIKAKANLPVQAVADGEVVFSEHLRGFGMLVILDHGDGFMTLYGGNREVTQNLGVWVEAGSTIATVGDTGGQKASGVYFEIRENAKPVDPEAWVMTDNTVISAQ